LSGAGLADLTKQKLCRIRSLTFERYNTTDSKRGNGFKHLAQLSGASLIESVVGAMGQFGELLEPHSRDLIASLLKHEHWHLEAGELLGRADNLVSRFLAAVSDKDHSVDFPLVCFA
jgi:hypothetical protein